MSEYSDIVQFELESEWFDRFGLFIINGWRILNRTNIHWMRMNVI